MNKLPIEQYIQFNFRDVLQLDSTRLEKQMAAILESKMSATRGGSRFVPNQLMTIRLTETPHDFKANTS
jgi:hypothetical protein